MARVIAAATMARVIAAATMALVTLASRPAAAALDCVEIGRVATVVMTLRQQEADMLRMLDAASRMSDPERRLLTGMVQDAFSNTPRHYTAAGRAEAVRSFSEAWMLACLDVTKGR